MKSVKKFIVSLLIPQLAGGIGSFFTASSVGTWYLTLKKPSINPPSWVFGPVWTGIFLLMGISLYLVWTAGNKNKKTAYIVFGVQLFLNILWSVLFFGLQSPGAAFLEICLLWIAIAANVIMFWRLSRPAGYLLLPYLFWVSFAAILNWNIWRLNAF